MPRGKDRPREPDALMLRAILGTLAAVAILLLLVWRDCGGAPGVLP